MDVQTNGTDPVASFDRYVSDAQERLAAEVANMRVLLEGERDLERRLTTLVEGSRERRKRLEKVIETLEPSPKPARRDRSGSNDWHVSDEKIAEVWELVRHRTDTFTAAGVSADTPGLSPESARRALQTLRERELLRMAGTGRGGGKLLAVMPGATEHEYEAAEHGA